MTVTLDIPVIETDRLVLRAPMMADFDSFVAFYATERSYYVGGPKTHHEVWRALLGSAGHWQMRGYGLWHLTLKDSGAPIGHAGILHHIEWPEPELAYAIFESHEGRGLAYEAALAARQAAATHFGLTRLISMIDPANTRSLALAARLGATHDGQVEIFGRSCDSYRHPEVTP